MLDLLDDLADVYVARHTMTPAADVFTKLEYEPNCKVRQRARDAGVDDDDLPPFCGECPQERFHSATEFDVLYGGAAGGGKTKALVMEGLRWCATYPGVRIGAFRRTFGELEESMLAELAAVEFAAALDAKWNGTKYDLNFANGSKLMFRYAENLNDATRRQGGQYQGLLFDERTLLAPGIADFLGSRVRSGRVDVPVLGIRSGSNPGGASHGDVKRRYIDATDYGQSTYVDERGREVRFIPSKLSDNPKLNPEYAHDLDGLPEAMRKAFRDGSWDAFSGQVFVEWNRDRHVVPPHLEIAPTWHRYVGLDWGYSAPWAVVWAAVDEDRRVWIYRGHQETQVGEKAQAEFVLAVERELGGLPIVARYADDAMWTGRGDAKSIADVYAENHCGLTPAHKGDRLSGLQRVHSYLADGPACPHHRAQGWPTCPRLHVLDGTAPDLVRTLPTLPYDTKGARIEDVDTKAEDHSYDALRYMLINLAPPSSFVMDDKVTDASGAQIETHETFVVRHDPVTSSVDFSDSRPAGAGTGVPSPYV